MDETSKQATEPEVELITPLVPVSTADQTELHAAALDTLEALVNRVQQSPFSMINKQDLQQALLSIWDAALSPEAKQVCERLLTASVHRKLFELAELEPLQLALAAAIAVPDVVLDQPEPAGAI